MGLGKLLTSFGAAAVVNLAPVAAEADGHHNHVVLGLEANTHNAMAHGGYFREIGGHISLGGAVGLGKSFHGETVGALEALVAYHKTLSQSVADGIFGVIEGGGGVEMVLDDLHGAHFEPVAKVTGLIGVQVNDTLGIFGGVNYIRTPDANHWSGSVGTVLGF